MESLLDDLADPASAVAVLAARTDIGSATMALSDAQVVSTLRTVAGIRKTVDLLAASLSSEIDRRSARDRGYSGLAQSEGFRTSTSLIQNVTGQSATDVRRATATGNDLLAAAIAVAPADAAKGAPGTSPAVPVRPWFAVLTDALTAGVLSREQYDAIRRGLGEPPVDRFPDSADALTTAWETAAEMLRDEAADQTVEDLRGSARLARDTLDPLGAQLRFEERFARRSFTMWIDDDGQTCARMRLDDDAAAWVKTILGAALRPRRVPRFVDADTSSDAAASTADAPDERSNEQLQYDTVLAILKTGALADPAVAFGDRQPGVRILTIRPDSTAADAAGAEAADSIGVYEETGTAVAPRVLETYLCNTGSVDVTLDTGGRPLDVGREHRLFTAKQRIALGIRDGGCLDCGAEPSRCEAHHIDEWSRDSGRTDLADGVLLCRNCRMRLHNQRSRIRRRNGQYWLESSLARAAAGAKPRLLRGRSPTRFQKLRA